MRQVVGHVLLHHLPGGAAGVIEPPPTPASQPLLTWHPAAGEVPDQRHRDLFTCWCRPIVIPVYAEI